MRLIDPVQPSTRGSLAGSNDTQDTTFIRRPILLMTDSLHPRVRSECLAGYYNTNPEATTHRKRHRAQHHCQQARHPIVGHIVNLWYVLYCSNDPNQFTFAAPAAVSRRAPRTPAKPRPPSQNPPPRARRTPPAQATYKTAEMFQPHHYHGT